MWLFSYDISYVLGHIYKVFLLYNYVLYFLYSVFSIYYLLKTAHDRLMTTNAIDFAVQSTQECI